MTARRMLVLLLITTSLLLGVGAAWAPAATRKLCASRANLYDTPRGLVVGRLHRPQRVTVLRRSANRRWVHVRARTGLRGWMTAGALCRG
jgi:hypothetical protein